MIDNLLPKQQGQENARDRRYYQLSSRQHRNSFFDPSHYCSSPSLTRPQINISSLHLASNPKNSPSKDQQNTPNITLQNSLFSPMHPITPRTNAPSTTRITTIHEKSPTLPPFESMASRCCQTCTSKLLAQLVDVLKEQNVNLKQQNSFLLDKLRQQNEQHKEALKIIGANDSILRDLKQTNKELRIEIEYLRELVKTRISGLSNRLEQSTANNQGSGSSWFNPNANNNYHHNHSSPASQMLDRFVESTPDNHRNSGSTNAGNINGRSEDYQTGLIILSEHDNRMLWQLMNEFQALLYKCRVETDYMVRRSIRKKLVDLTYKIKAIRRGGGALRDQNTNK